jgi:hypothetical protein
LTPAELFEPGNGLAELPEAGGLYRHEPGNRRSVTRNGDLLTCRHPVEETGQVGLCLECPYRVHISTID